MIGSEDSGQDKRKRSRVPIQLTVVLSYGNKEIQVSIKNISLKGILCEYSPELLTGTHCQLLIWLAADTLIHLHGKIVRTDKTGTAIDFVKMDAESFAHLYNLVKFNVRDRDPDFVDKEIDIPAFDDKPTND